ncbi:ubiquinol-cytochrome c reductase iron-sulfur subunit [Pseudomonadota bacterium]
MKRDNETISRRTFLNRIWALIGTLAFAELIVLVISFFKPRKPRSAASTQDTIVVAGPVDRFEPGTVTAFVRGKFYLARLEDGGFLALSRTCTHLSCTVPWVAAENRFICPCHASEFDIRGNVINPPAPRALDLYAIRIENNVLRIDTAKLTRRSEFSPDQVSYSKSV